MSGKFKLILLIAIAALSGCERNIVTREIDATIIQAAQFGATVRTDEGYTGYIPNYHGEPGDKIKVCLVSGKFFYEHNGLQKIAACYTWGEATNEQN